MYRTNIVIHFTEFFKIVTNGKGIIPIYVITWANNTQKSELISLDKIAFVELIFF